MVNCHLIESRSMYINDQTQAGKAEKNARTHPVNSVYTQR